MVKKVNLKNQKGITLIALVVTIIVLLILSGLTINTIINSGTIDKSAKAVDEYQIHNYKERIATIVTKEAVQKEVNKDKEKLIKLAKDAILEEKWAKEVQTREEDDSLDEYELKVITKENYRIITTVKDDAKFTDVDIVDGEPYPTINAEVSALEGIENEKIKVRVTAQVEETEKTKKIAKLEVIKEGILVETKECNGLSVVETFELDLGGTYVFKATTDQEKTARKNLTIKISLADSTITSELDILTPRNTVKVGEQNGIATGPLTLTVDYGETKYQKQYKVSDGEWQNVEEDIAKVEIRENDTILMRYFDGRNGIGLKKFIVGNVDNIPPTINDDFDPKSNEATITILGSATDTASVGASEDIGVVARYIYSLDGTNYVERNTFKVTEPGTYRAYIKAIDRAGNETIKEKDVIVRGHILTRIAGTGGTVSGDSGEIVFERECSVIATESEGYTFDGWYEGDTKVSSDKNYTFNMPANDYSIEARFTANTDTPYTVKHYQEQLDGKYKLIDTDNLKGTTDTKVKPETKTYEGFTSPEAQEITIKGDGTTLVEYRYTRNTYILTINKGEEIESVTGAGQYKLGESVTVTAVLPEQEAGYSYSFGWYNGSTQKSINTTYTFEMPASDLTLTADLIKMPIIYPITLDNQGATTEGTTQIYEKYGTGIYKEVGCTTKMSTTQNNITIPTKTEYEFKGYYTETNGSGTQLIDENGYITTDLTTTKYTQAVTIYAAWKLNNVAPNTPSVSLASRSTNNFVVNATATDPDGDNLTYKLYVKTSNGSYSLAATKSGISSGSSTKLTASGLSSYTVYNYYVTVTDGIETVTDSQKTTGTACAGTGNSCEGNHYAPRKCTKTKYCQVQKPLCDGELTISYVKHVEELGYSWTMGSLKTKTCKRCGETKECYDYDVYKVVSCNVAGCGTSATGFPDICESCQGSRSNSTETTNKRTYTCLKCGAVSTLDYHYSGTAWCTEHSMGEDHYYCTTHDYVGTSSSHDYSELVQCSHNITDSHTYCSHGYTYTHYPAGT